MPQTEAQLEQALVRRLDGLGWEFVTINDSASLWNNLKSQLEAFNKTQFSHTEFSRIRNHLDKGNVFDKAKILRDRMALQRDDGTTVYLQFLNLEEWCRNLYQVTTQVTQEGAYKNRYDVTLLVNGLPLIQIELKRKGVELKEAFNQINRYQRHSYWSEGGLFQYVQIFVISNGVNTKYYANNRQQDFKQTFFWADTDNNKSARLETFADNFLEKCHASKMISKYIVLHESNRVPMVLRPYQFHAVEAIVNRVHYGRKNGYIWHTTGSGKTLTSFKAAQLLIEIPKVYKVVFVVDRNDLDYQTTREFNHFSEGSVDGTTNTQSLVNQLSGENKLIVTTIQKLNNAISKNRFEPILAQVKDKRVVFIFDECHRSQFGETHKRIVEFFTRSQLFGFTGTPIFADNAVKAGPIRNRTTKDLFGDCLHKYVITDAINDEAVLRFSIEYWGRLRRKDGNLVTDEEVAGINTREFFENEHRISEVADWIISNHSRKTIQEYFTSILCVSSVKALIKYYEIFKSKKARGEHDLRIATIFTYTANEEDADANGLIGDPDFDFADSIPTNVHTREKLESFISDYNAMYQTAFSCKDSIGFYNYYKDIAKRIKERERTDFKDCDRVDILLVVNMFLTGFDARKINTLYIDKNLRYHGLIQTYSRTNRTLGKKKSHGNIVCFRNLKEKTDEAITLFSNKEAIETVLMEPYENYVDQFNKAVMELRALASTVDGVDQLISEEEKLNFVIVFRKLIRLRSIIETFTDYDASHLTLTPLEFEEYKTKYLDIHDRVRRGDEAVSIIDEVDFELELIHRDEINVAYILALLAESIQEEASLDEKSQVKGRKKREMVNDLLKSETQLRSKRELIERFIQDHMYPSVNRGESVEMGFTNFWENERKKAINSMQSDLGIDSDNLIQMIEEYHFSGREPLHDDIVYHLRQKPTILQRKTMIQRVIDGIQEFVRTFDEYIGDI